MAGTDTTPDRPASVGRVGGLTRNVSGIERVAHSWPRLLQAARNNFAPDRVVVLADHDSKAVWEIAVNEARARGHLAEAEHHIEKAELRISAQKTIIKELTRDGHNTGRSTALLAVFEATLEQMLNHRDVMLRELQHATVATAR